MANAVTAGSLYKFLGHKRKVLALYKKAQRHLEDYCHEQGRHVWAYERTLLRARFDRYKNEEDFTRAAQLLRLGEEEFWQNQHPDPTIFPDQVDGVMYQRSWTYQAPESVMDMWHPTDKAMLPDYYANREKWYGVRRKTWSEEMKCLQQWDKKNEEDGVPLTDALPAANEKDGYPPFWWRTVTRPLERPEVMEWFPDQRDHW